MLRMAKLWGDDHPESIRAVATTFDQARQAATPGDFVNDGLGGEPAYLVVMSGNFTAYRLDPKYKPVIPIFKKDLLAYRAMLVDILAKVKTLRDQGKSLTDVLAANLTARYDKTTQGDTQQSKDRFITEAYDEVKDFPPLVDGKRTMPRHP